MGLGVHVTAEVPAKGLLSRRPGRDAVFQSIAKAVQAATNDPLMQLFLGMNQSEHTLCIDLMPGAESVFFEWDPAGTVTASAKTSTLGPGYHVYVVDTLDAISLATGLQWNWADCDEASYALDRDFGRLQREMAKFLKTLAGIVASPRHAWSQNLMINWPLNAAAPQDGGFVVTPLGPISREWLEKVAVAGEDELLSKAGPQFFAWWNKLPDARFWRAMGRQFMWSEIRWHPPANEQEQSLYHLTLACFDRAAELDPKLQLPAKEIAELRALLETEVDAAPVPSRDGIGFFRGPVLFRPGGWNVTLDGYFHEEASEEGSMTYFHGDRVVRVTPLAVGGGDGPPTGEALMNSVAANEGGEPVIDIAEPSRLVKAWRSVSEEDGQACTHLAGGVTTDGRLAVVTITYTDPAHANWAEQVFRSIRPPDERQEN